MSSEVDTCEWCWDADATGNPMAVSAEVGGAAALCGYRLCPKCRMKATRFSSALACTAKFTPPILEDSGWLPDGKPDLVISIEGQKPMTVMDGRQLKTKAIRAMLPKPPRKARKRKAAPKRQEALTPAEQVRAVAKRRRELEREREAIDAETRRLVELAQTDRTLSVSGIADALGLSRQRLYQLAGS